MVKIDFSEKNALDPFWDKKGKSGRGSWAERIQNERFPRYIDFASSDFDETLRKCSWYKENED